MAKLLSGKEVTASLNEEIRKKTELLTAHHITPKLGIIRIGEREDDISYERGATKRCETLGVSYEKFLLPEDASEEMVLNTIAQVNEADDIHGVLLFRPLPRHLDENKIINALAVEKDIDGITDRSMASVFLGKQTGFAPCTPSACMKILDHYGIDCSGKRAHQLLKSDYEKYDLLIGMDHANLRNMQRICGGDPAGKMHLLMDFTNRPGEVADPWYTGDFDTTWRDVEEGCQGLLQKIIHKQA